ncbi:MAG: hypothetical protein IKE36_08910 [Solobacterium sp.]|nr:hypothetical protein [Solobacterium sp.]
MLQIFEFINDSMNEYHKRYATFEYAEVVLRNAIEDIIADSKIPVVSVYSRIKSAESFEEKILRNKFYQFCSDGKETLDNMHDLVGITVECQFIRNESDIYHALFNYFDRNIRSFSPYVNNPNIYLNLDMIQPQLQRNGFTIFRIDGAYYFNGQRINFELQIKSLVHKFWSEIEHEVVYKNPDFISYDQFLKNMLGSVRDNLDIVDHQLELIYDEISYQSQNIQIGFDERAFKNLTASSISEFINKKMKDSMGFALDFKKSAALLSQYIYIHEFINDTDSRIKMLDYLEHLNLLSSVDIDFRQPIILETTEIPSDPFCTKLIQFWQLIMNEDFEWHVFFIVLFMLQQDDPVEVIKQFAVTYRNLLIQPAVYNRRFLQLEDTGTKIRDAFADTLANTLISSRSIKMVEEETVYNMMVRFSHFIDDTELRYTTAEELMNALPSLQRDLSQTIRRLLS